MHTFLAHRLGALLLAAGAVAGLSATTAAASAQAISAQPTLQPAFDPAISDYVTRCTGSPVRLIVDAPSDATVAVDGDGPRSGSFERDVALSPSSAFSFTVVGASGGTYHVRCLPADFPPYTAQRTGTPQASDYLVTPDLALGAFPAGYSQGYAAIYDNGGAPVWWYEAPTSPVDAKLLPNGHIAWNQGGAQGAMEERTLDGTLVRDLNTVGHASDLHELQLLPNGDYLLPIYRPLDHVDLSAIGGPADTTILDGVVQELTPDGALVWEWRASDHIAPSEMPASWSTPLVANASPPYDIYHLNSVEPDGDGLVISFRALDAVFKVAASGAGDVEWKLGGTDVPGASLQVIGDPVLAGPSPDPDGPLAGQHDARILPGGDLTVHDNGTHLVGGVWHGRAPRAVRFAIDEAAGTATFVTSVADAAVAQSVCCGGARQLPGGDWVLSWGGTGHVSELTAAGERVFELDFPSPIFSYRANPIMADQVGSATLRSGMDARFGRSSLTMAGGSPDLGGETPPAVGAPRTFTVTNSGDSPVTISAVALAGADGAEFAFAGGGCRGARLAVGASCEEDVRFTPQTAGAKTATLRIVSDAASSPNEAVLTAVGQPATQGPPAASVVANGARETAPARFAPRALRIAAGCRRLTAARVRCTITSGTLVPAVGLRTLSRRTVCTGAVRVRYMVGDRILVSRRVALRAGCTYRATIAFVISRRLARRLRVQARYAGNAVSLPARSRSARVRATS